MGNGFTYKENIPIINERIFKWVTEDPSLTDKELGQRLGVSRQTLWRWRRQGSIPAGHRYRDGKTLFTATEVEAIRQFANRVEPLDEVDTKQLKLFNTDFDKLATDTFGTDSDKILKSSKTLMEANIPDVFKEHVGKLSNENLIVMASVLNNIQKKYIKEDDMPEGGGSPSSEADRRTERMNLMASKEYSDEFHPEHAKVKARVAELYGNIK